MRSAGPPASPKARSPATAAMGIARRLLTVSFAVTVAGCGILTPTKRTPQRRAPQPPARPGRGRSAARARRTEPAAGAPAASAAAPTPQAALARFARLYCNWPATQLTARSTSWPRLSTGQARAQALHARARAAGPRALPGREHRNGRGDRGRPRPRARRAGRSSPTRPPAAAAPTRATGHQPRHLGHRHPHRHTGYVLSGWYPAS